MAGYVPEEAGARDAQWELQQGCALDADEALRLAEARRELGRHQRAAYWDGYAREVARNQGPGS